MYIYRELISWVGLNLRVRRSLIGYKIECEIHKGLDSFDYFITLGKLALLLYSGREADVLTVYLLLCVHK